MSANDFRERRYKLHLIFFVDDKYGCFGSTDCLGSFQHMPLNFGGLRFIHGLARCGLRSLMRNPSRS